MNSAETNGLAPEQQRRKRTVDLLARATGEELTEAWNTLPEKPELQMVRGPETGLVMVRGRIGGGGAPFNLGEVTVTRATVRLVRSGTIGHAQAFGTRRDNVRLAAVFDALHLEDATRDFVEAQLLSRIEQRIAAAERRKAEETAATRVDFFTMVRGED